MRLMDSRCEDEEGECKKGEHHTTTTDLTHRCVGTDTEGDDDKDGQGGQSVETEVSRHDGKGGGSKHCMWDKEGYRLEDWKQFGRDLDFVFGAHVEGVEQVPFRAELKHR